MTGSASLGRRLAAGLLSVFLAAGLAACGGGGGGGSSTPVDTTGLVTVTAAAASVEIGGRTTATASVNGNTAGVTWTLTGLGSLANATTTTVDYVAPATLDGASTATITATSVANAAQVGSVSVTVLGTPQLDAVLLYPANDGIAYSANLSVQGGVAPFTWAVSSGTLPSGLTLGTGTTATNTITGTPSGVGTQAFTVTVTDSKGRTSSQPVTIRVAAKDSCLLEGNYAFQFSGFSGDSLVIRSGRFAIGSDGKVTGVEDFADSSTAQVGAALASGICKRDAASQGTLDTDSPAGKFSYRYAAVFSFAEARVAETGNSGIRGSGALSLVTGTPPADPAGDYAFGLYGEDTGGERLGVVGRMTVATGGAISGRADAIGNSPQTAAALTGTFGAFDANGRASGSFSFGGRTLAVSWYAVTPDRYYAISAGSQAPRLVGYITRQAGAGSFAASSLAGPGVLTAWGAKQGVNPRSPVNTIGRLANGTATTIDATLETTTRATTPVAETIAGATLTVDPDGRAVVAAADGSRRYVIYLDGASNGYLIETTGANAAFGLLERQSGAPFDPLLVGTFVANTQFGAVESPVLLANSLRLSAGALANPISGSYSLDATTGRGIGTASVNYFGGLGFVLIVVNPDKIVVLGDGQGTQNGGSTTGPVGSAITWLQR